MPSACMGGGVEWGVGGGVWRLFGSLNLQREISATHINFSSQPTCFKTPDKHPA